MSTDVNKKIQLEIAHVLFIDIVGYSKLSINDQSVAINELTQAVRTSEQFQNAEAGARFAAMPLETDTISGPAPIEILARVAARLGEPGRAIVALHKLLSIPCNDPTGCKPTAHSCAAPARSDVRSAAKRSALPTTRICHAVASAKAGRLARAEVKQRRVDK